MDPPHAQRDLPPGLRERKKAATRQAISDTATRLFIDRGFDAVTLAEVAEVAGVSIKTIFNYFGSKEELFLDREAELRAVILAAVTARPPGRTITEALAGLLADERVPGLSSWEGLGDPDDYELFRGFLATWRGSIRLQGRYLIGSELLNQELCATLAGEVDLPAHDDRVRTMAELVVAAINLRLRTLADLVIARAPAAEVERRVRAVVAESFGRIGAAFGDLDAPRAPADGV